MRNYPWYKGWHEKFATKGVTLIGVHTPETKDEGDIDKLKKKIKDNGIKYAVAVDNEFKTWKAWGNQYWPSTYVIDKKGNVRYRWDGELNWKETKGEETMRKKIEELMAEKE